MEITYAFVDGAYLERAYLEIMGKFYSQPFEIDFHRLKLNLKTRRVFYYDCIYKRKRSSETVTDARKRIRAKRAFLDRIQSIDGFHVRLGVIKGDGKKERQKEVDVKLAVDMLDHAHRKNYERAVLIAGDLDFRPVVRAVVKTGALVRVIGDKKSLQRQLAQAADSREHMTLEWAHNIAVEGFRTKYKFPNMQSVPPPDIKAASSILPNSNVFQDERGQFWMEIPSRDAWACFHDQEWLERFAKVLAES